MIRRSRRLETLKIPQYLHLDENNFTRDKIAGEKFNINFINVCESWEVRFSVVLTGIPFIVLIGYYSFHFSVFHKN